MVSCAACGGFSSWKSLPRCKLDRRQSPFFRLAGLVNCVSRQKTLLDARWRDSATNHKWWRTSGQSQNITQQGEQHINRKEERESFKQLADHITLIGCRHLSYKSKISNQFFIYIFKNQSKPQANLSKLKQIKAN